MFSRDRRMGLPTAIRALICVLVIALLAPAAAADSLSRARLLPLVGSERLRLFTLGRVMQADPAATGAMRRAMQAGAFYHDAGTPAVLGRGLRVAPVLAWDGNINGGFLNDSFDLAGLSFAVAPANQAQAGIVAGARAGGEARVAWGPGRYLDLRFGAEAAWSPAHDIGRAGASASACARSHLTGWVFADLCLGASGSWRRLADSRSVALGGTLTRLFATNAAYHEVSLGIERRRLDEGPQSAMTLGWGAVWNRATTEISLTLARPVAGQTVQRNRLSAEVGLLWRDRPLTVGVWHAQASGGMFMGQARADATSGLSVSFRPRPAISVEIVYQRTRSSVDLFDENRAGLNLSFDLSR